MSSLRPARKEMLSEVQRRRIAIGLASGLSISAIAKRERITYPHVKKVAAQIEAERKA